MAEEQKTAAERDAEFIKSNPGEGAAVLAGAVMTGAEKAIEKAAENVREMAGKLTEPGDMRIGNSPHPVDGLKAAISGLAEPGDMNLAHSPHPLGQAIEATNNKIEEIRQAGIVQGAALGTEAMVGVVIENVGPGKKLDWISDALETAKHIDHASGTVRKVDGELLPKGGENAGIVASNGEHAAGQMQALSNELGRQALQASPMSQALQVARHPIETVVRHFATAEEVLVSKAHSLKPGLMDHIDVRHHGVPGEELDLIDEHNRMLARARVMGKALDGNPEMQAFVKGMNDEALGKLLKSNQFDEALIRTLTSDQSDEALALAPMARRLPPQSDVELTDTINQMHSSQSSAMERERALGRQEARADMSPFERVVDFLKMHATYPGGAIPSRHDADRLARAEKDSDVIKTLAKGVGEKYIVGKTIVAGAIVAAGYEMAKDEETRSEKLTPNERIAELFSRTAGNVEMEKEASKPHPELKPVYDRYHQAREEALKRHPPVGGRSDEASADIYRSRQQLTDFIRQGGLEKQAPLPDLRSSVEGMPAGMNPEQKVAAASKVIQSLPENQQEIVRGRIAMNANASGFSVEETHEYQVEQSHDRSA